MQIDVTLITDYNGCLGYSLIPAPIEAGFKARLVSMYRWLYSASGLAFESYLARVTVTAACNCRGLHLILIRWHN